MSVVFQRTTNGPPRPGAAAGYSVRCSTSAAHHVGAVVLTTDYEHRASQQVGFYCHACEDVGEGTVWLPLLLAARDVVESLTSSAVAS